MVDVAPVPHGLEEPVGEAKHHDVLHRLLAEVVIDAVDLALLEHPAQLGIELARRVQIASEGLLDDHPAPPRRLALDEPRLPQSPHDLAEELRRSGEVEEDIAHGAMGLGRFVEDRLELGVGLGVAEFARLVVEGGADLGPQGLVHRLGGELVDVLRLLLAKLLVALFLARHPHDGELTREKAGGLEVVQRGHELALGQVSRRAEDDEGAGRGRPESGRAHDAALPRRSSSKSAITAITSRKFIGLLRSPRAPIASVPVTARNRSATYASPSSRDVGDLSQSRDAASDVSSTRPAVLTRWACAWQDARRPTGGRAGRGPRGRARRRGAYRAVPCPGRPS